jgi:hypothetical protein
MALLNVYSHKENVLQKRQEFKSCLASYENLIQLQKVKSTCNDFYCHVSYSQPHLVDKLRDECKTKEEKLIKAQYVYDNLTIRNIALMYFTGRQ